MRTKAIHTHNPRLRRRSNWGSLSRAELRLLMAGLADWESRSTGQVLARIRRKRLEAVAYFHRRHGALSADRLWVSRSGPVENRPANWLSRRHEPQLEHMPGVLWSTV